MAKIAIPVTDNKLSDSFTNCSKYLIYETDGNTIVGEVTEVLPENISDNLESWTQIWNITDIITHHIRKSVVAFFAETKINMFIGVSVTTPDTLIEKYLDGTLKSDANLIIHQ